MPKTGTNSVLELTKRMGELQPAGHSPARAVLADRRWEAVCLYGLIRPPGAWYRSWMSHCLSVNLRSNERVSKTLRAYGRGSLEWRDVLYGLTHPAEVAPYAGDLPLRDHLLNPAGDQLTATDGGLWSRSVRWFYQGAGGSWAIDRLVVTGPCMAEDLGAIYGRAVDLRRLNRGQQLAGLELDAEMRGWIAEADGALVRQLWRAGGAPVNVVHWLWALLDSGYLTEQDAEMLAREGLR